MHYRIVLRSKFSEKIIGYFREGDIRSRWTTDKKWSTSYPTCDAAAIALDGVRKDVGRAGMADRLRIERSPREEGD